MAADLWSDRWWSSHKTPHLKVSDFNNCLGRKGQETKCFEMGWCLYIVSIYIYIYFFFEKNNIYSRTHNKLLNDVIKWALKTFFFDRISKPIPKVGLHRQSLLGRFNVSVPATLCLPKNNTEKRHVHQKQTINIICIEEKCLKTSHTNEEALDSSYLFGFNQRTKHKSIDVHWQGCTSLVFQTSQIRDPPKAPCLMSNDRRINMK